MRTTAKFPGLITTLITLFGVIWLVLLFATNMPIAGHLVFILIAAWIFELYSTAKHRAG